MKNRLASSIGAFAFAAASAWGGPALAQSAPAAPAAEDEGLGEIIVTAQHRQQNLQDVPLSVSVVNAEMIENAGVTDLESLAAAFPSVTIARQANASSVYLRGVGAQGTTAGTEQTVITYIDDVYVPGAAANVLEFNNIERIEVLKGPQGTLFGRNAVGGVLNITTRNPTQDTVLEADVGYASFDTLTANVYGNMPLSDTLSGNLSVHYGNRGEGWGTNLTTGNDAFTMVSTGARGKLLWEPTANTTALLSADYLYYNGGEGIQRSPLPGTVGAGGNTNVGWYNVAHNVDPINRTHQYGLSLRVDHEFNDLLLTSITAGRVQRGRFYYDADGTPTPATIVDIYQDEDSFTQELRLSSNSESPLQWMAGLYYFQTHNAQDPKVFYLASGVSEVATEGDTESIAAFGQATYHFNEQFSATLGLRYTEDQRDIQQVGFFNGVQNPAQTTDQQLSQDQWTYRAALEYRPTEDILTYVSYNRGYKSGSFDFGTATNPPVDPEILDAYEIGVKSDWMGNRLRLNAAAFSYQYSDIQLLQLFVGSGSGTSRLLNAAEAEINGVEAEISFLPIQNLEISAAATLMDAEYTDFAGGPHFAPNGGPVTCSANTFPPGSPGGQTSVVGGCDLSGNQMINAPDLTANLSAVYTLPLANSASVNFGVSYAYRDGYPLEPDASISQDALGLLSAFVKYTAPEQRWNVRLWGRNLTDEEYFSTAVSGASGRLYSPAEPLTVGVTFGVSLH